MRKLSRFLAALALPILAGSVRAEESAIRLAPARANVSAINQTLADDLALAMQSSGRLSQYSIDISAEGGIVTLAGKVANAQQRAEALNIARRQLGVVAVEDRLQSRQAEPVVAVLFQEPPTSIVPPSAAPAPSLIAPPTNGNGAPVSALPIAGNNGAAPSAGAPYPSNTFPGGVAPYSDTPVVPPYAWPAYTPYNNFASMAYQTQYPSGAWPFIGPPHPYPMIPSGWRSVNLRWRKGYWWLKFNAF